MSFKTDSPNGTSQPKRVNNLLHFFSRRVGIKIALGYSLILVLMISLGALAINSLNQVRTTINDFTHQLVVEKELVDQISQGVTGARFYANRYLFTHSQNDLDQFNREFTELQATLAKGQDIVTNPVRRQMLAQISVDVNNYQAAYDDVARLIISEQQIQAEVLDLNGQILDNKLSALRVHITSRDDPALFLAFGNAQNSVQTMRLNAQRYFVNYDERFPILMENSYAVAKDSFLILQKSIDDPEQQRNISDAILALDEYHNGFIEVQSGATQLRSIFNAKLDVLEPRITNTAEKMTENIKQELNQKNQSASTLVNQTSLALIVTALLSLIGGTLLAGWSSRRITTPLRQVMLASQQIANEDLRAFTGQMWSMAEGDVRLNLKINASPLNIKLEDEVGQMAQAFNQIILELHQAEIAFHRMSAYLNEMAGAAHTIAAGEFATKLSPRSPNDILGNALVNMLANLQRADRQIQRQLERLETLHSMDIMISTNQNLETILAYLLEKTREHLQVDAAVIMLAKPVANATSEAYWSGGKPLPGMEACLNHVMENWTQLTVKAGDQDEYERALAATGMQVFNGLPLIIQYEMKGVLAIFMKNEIQVDDEWKNFFETLASQASISIANAELLQNLEEKVNIRTRQMNESRRFFEALVENSPVAIIVRDLDGIIMSWNPAAKHLFGYKPEEVIGLDLDEVITNEEYRQEAQEYTDHTRRQILHAFTKRVRKDGSMVDVEVSGVPIIVDGKHVAELAMYHDISELEHARIVAEDAARAKSDFLANMSHEIRTPMNGVIGMTSLLLDTPLRPEQREYVETIRKSGDALLAIVNDILDFSKIEAGKLELDIHPFDLRACVESAIDLVSYQASDKGLELLFHVSEETPRAVIGDMTRLRQILVNLINNAIKFTPSGEVEISVVRENDPNRASQPGTVNVHFMVRDTGIGIPPERMGRLFQLFSQVDSSTTRRFGGTGLGLAICKRLTELMNGDIWVESEGIAGKGTTFHVQIPFQRSEQSYPTSVNFPRQLLIGKSLLVVDDNATNRKIIDRMAASWGINTINCESGAEALEKIDAGTTADAALLDVHMPEMDGFMLSAELRKRKSEKELPIIILSSMGNQKENPNDVHLFAFLHKPIKPSQLYDTLASAMSDYPIGLDTPELNNDVFDEKMADRHPLRILLAEDHPVNQKVVKLMLEKLGYLIDVAGNGLEVITAFRRQQYDVVLMDVQMPEMNGVEATKFLRNNLPIEKQPRIIAMTANALGGEREEYIASGMDDYLSKPISVAQLCNILEKCMPLDLEAATERARARKANKESDEKNAIDVELLKEYFPYEGEDVKTLLGFADEFFAETERRLAQLHDELRENDAINFGETAHALKGASMLFGARQFASLCEKLEQMGKNENLSEAHETLAQAEAEFPRLRSALLLALQGMLA